MTFLVIQWLRLCIPNVGGPGLIPGQGTRAHMLQLSQSKEINNKDFPGGPVVKTAFLLQGCKNLVGELRSHISYHVEKGKKNVLKVVTSGC